MNTQEQPQRQPELDRYLGCLLGLACGDAVGTTVEFSPRGSFAPITDMVGGGPFDLPVGAWTDDTSMALCLAHSLLYRQGFDPTDQMNRYCNWANFGYLSSTGECFDIGGTVARALQAYQSHGNPWAGSTDPRTAGNGSLMRLAPVAMYYARRPADLIHYAGESARTTHGAPEAIDATRYFAALLGAALNGADKMAILEAGADVPLTPAIRSLAAGDWRRKTRAEIQGTGYVVAALEAALWCFHYGEDYRETVLLATNLGDDADTTAAIAGQLAGALYGVHGIPRPWQEKLAQGEDIATLAKRLWLERPTA